MSHQVKQVGTVKILDLEILRRACEAVHVPELQTSTRLDMDKKAARFWAGHNDPCDGVIHFGRELNEDEKDHYYEIALKREGEGDAASYGLWCDTHGVDRGIEDRVKRIFQAYRVEELRAEGANVGAVYTSALEERPGWTRVRVEIP